MKWLGRFLVQLSLWSVDISRAVSVMNLEDRMIGCVDEDEMKYVAGYARRW